MDKKMEEEKETATYIHIYIYCLSYVGLCRDYMSYSLDPLKA